MRCVPDIWLQVRFVRELIQVSIRVLAGIVSSHMSTNHTTNHAMHIFEQRGSISLIRLVESSLFKDTLKA